TPCFAQHPDHRGTVEAVKAQLQAAGTPTSGACGAFNIAARVAWQLRAEGAGVLDKKCCDGNGNFYGVGENSPTHCEFPVGSGHYFSSDIVIYPDGLHYDILSDAGGLNGPQWNLVGPIDDISRYRAAIDPGDTAPIPVPQPQPLPLPLPQPIPQPQPAPFP